jgi:Asp-tRNA(Asn)/Glu-tRNA(Gln) amidotransferase A subunit family amidase
MKKATNSRRRSADKGSTNKDRRSFIKMLPTAGAAGVMAVRDPAATETTIQQSQSPDKPQRVSKDALHAASTLIGLELTEAHEQMALQNVNQNLDRYELLRKIHVPLDTPLATTFHPWSAVQKPVASGKPLRRGKLALSKISVPNFNSLEDVAFCTVAQLAQLIRSRKISSVELTKMYLARLKRYAPKLHCAVTLTEDLALKQAEAADHEIRRGKYRGPLHGIPWGAKDLFATKGIPTTWGAEPYRHQMIDYDATVIERLRDAGAVLLAKLSMGSLAMGGLWFEDMTRNPWQIEETRTGSSGSSAGSASATSAGLVGFSLGTETLGSIVSPSSRCGVAGLRPTYGRVSRYGAMALSWTMDKVGPICRSIEDCALVLEAIYGSDGRDESVEDVPFNWSPDTNISNLKIGYLKNEFDNQQGERKKMYEEALDVLRSAGAKLQAVELPKFSTDSLRIILNAEAATAFDDLTRDGGVNKLTGQSPNDWPNSFRSARFIPAVEYLRALRARTLLMREMDKLMSQWDGLVSPAPGSASLLITNLTGHPQSVVPCGFISNLPQAMMFTGRLYDEVTPSRMALAFERATRWHTLHPKLD